MAATWFQIISHLEEYLSDNVEATVGQGFNRNETIPAPPAVRIYRSAETELEIWMRPKGTLEITMEIWEGNDDQDPRTANEALANLEEAVQAALINWPAQAMSDMKIKITDVRFGGISGDGENYRPQVCAFYKLIVKWAK